MILGVGVDLLDVKRVEREAARDKDFQKTILTPAEQKRCATSSFSSSFSATTFAAKEALFKALGTGKRGKMSWQDVDVQMEPPTIHITGATKRVAERKGVKQIHLDVQNKGKFGAAVVVLEGNGLTGRK